MTRFERLTRPAELRSDRRLGDDVLESDDTRAWGLTRLPWNRQPLADWPGAALWNVAEVAWIAELDVVQELPAYGIGKTDFRLYLTILQTVAGPDLKSSWLSDGTQCPVCQSVLWPLLVAPSHLKDYRNPHLAQVWYETQRVLRQASRVIFVGYSMPDDDVEVVYLVKRTPGPCQSKADHRGWVLRRKSSNLCRRTPSWQTLPDVIRRYRLARRWIGSVVLHAWIGDPQARVQAQTGNLSRPQAQALVASSSRLRGAFGFKGREKLADMPASIAALERRFVSLRRFVEAGDLVDELEPGGSHLIGVTTGSKLKSILRFRRILIGTKSEQPDVLCRHPANLIQDAR